MVKANQFEKTIIPNNEGKACDAVVRWLEQCIGEKYSAMYSPENEGDDAPVELYFVLGSHEYAIEHTLIEAFPNQTRTGIEFERLIKPAGKTLSGTLPGAAVYFLSFPTDARLQIKASDFDKVLQDFMEWVREKAGYLYRNNLDKLDDRHKTSRFLDYVEEKPPEFRYLVRLSIRQSFKESEQSTLYYARYAPEELVRGSLLRDRLQMALNRKCPKLRCHKIRGANTILVLEDNDIALTDHILIGEQLTNLLDQSIYIPDEIYLLETFTRTWCLRDMKNPAESWPILAEFDQDNLLDLKQTV